MNEINDKLSQRDEMSLLYLQSLEILNLYYQSIQKNIFNPCKYFLLPKNWVDAYKNQHNYNIIKKQLDNNSDYNSFKYQILKDNFSQNRKSGISINSQNEDIPQIEKNFKKVGCNIDIEYPIDFYPIKEEILKNTLNDKKDYLYELIIGENNIFVIDNKSKKNIFICSIYSEQEEIDDFIVNVDYIISYFNEKKFETEMNKYISDNNGFKKYCKLRHLIPKLNEIQNIFDNEGEKIGFFFTINVNDYETPLGTLLDYINKVNNINLDKGNNISREILETELNFGNFNLITDTYSKNPIQNLNHHNINNINIINNQNQNNNINISHFSYRFSNPNPNQNQNNQNDQNNIFNHENNNVKSIYKKNIKRGGKYIINIDGDLYYQLKRNMYNDESNNNNFGYIPNNNNNYNRNINNDNYNNNFMPNNQNNNDGNFDMNSQNFPNYYYRHNNNNNNGNNMIINNYYNEN